MKHLLHTENPIIHALTLALSLLPLCALLCVNLFLLLMAHVHVHWFFTQQFNLIAMGINSLSTFSFVGSMVLLIPVIRFTFIRLLLIPITIVYYLLNSFLLIYLLVRGASLDFYFLWYNRTDIVAGLQALFDSFSIAAPWYMLIVVLTGACVLLIYSFIFFIDTVDRKTSSLPLWLRVSTGILLLYLTVGLASPIRSESINFLQGGLQSRSELMQAYNHHYETLIEHKKLQNYPLENIAIEKENIFVVQLESVNGKLVTPAIQPFLIEVGKTNGVLFTNIQSTSVHTSRGQEALLCGTPPSLREPLAYTAHIEHELYCLPRVLKGYGYTTLYFQNFEVDFANTQALMQAIGFDEVHGADIMHTGDRRYGWGYQEDTFYQRVFEYLNQYEKERLFVYIVVGEVNHFPFYEQEKYRYNQFKSIVPYPYPRTLRERLASSTYIQDYYVNQMYRELFVPQYSERSHLMVVGDHSWPLGLHENNIFNEYHAWQENFQTVFAFIPAQRSSDTYIKGKTVTDLFSQTDIPLTILNLVDTTIESSKSLNNYIVKGDARPAIERCIISAQPYGERELVLIMYPYKYIFSFKTGVTSVYHLDIDPDEKQPIQKYKTNETDVEILHKCLGMM